MLVRDARCATKARIAPAPTPSTQMVAMAARRPSGPVPLIGSRAATVSAAAADVAADARSVGGNASTDGTPDTALGSSPGGIPADVDVAADVPAAVVPETTWVAVPPWGMDVAVVDVADAP